MQQGLDYAGLLEVPFVYASHGDSFIFHDKTNPQAQYHKKDRYV